MHIEWWSYDDIADVYASITEQVYFAEPARDLVSLLNLQPSDRVLDVGTGAGVVAAAAVGAAPAARVIGCDPAIGMLEAARRRQGSVPVAAGSLPQLPFASGSFHAATAAFVLSHIRDTFAALSEVKRVLAVGGRVGVTSWCVSGGASAPGRVWESVSNRFVSGTELATASEGALPSENHLSSLESLADEVRRAGFAGVESENRIYPVEIETDEFIRSRLGSMSARYLAAHLSATDWQRFLAAASEELKGEFGEELSFETSVNFVSARRED